MNADTKIGLGRVHVANGKRPDQQWIEHGVTQDGSQRKILCGQQDDRVWVSVDVDRVMWMLVPDGALDPDQQSKSFTRQKRMNGNFSIASMDPLVSPDRSLNQSRNEFANRGVGGL